MRTELKTLAYIAAISALALGIQLGSLPQVFTDLTAAPGGASAAVPVSQPLRG